MLNKIKVILTIKILLFVGISFLNSSISFSVEIDNEKLNETYGPEPPAEQFYVETENPESVLTPKLKKLLDEGIRKYNESHPEQNATPKKRVVDPEVRPSRNSFGDTEIHRSNEPVSIECVIRRIQQSHSIEETKALLESYLTFVEDDTIKLQIKELLKDPERTHYTYGPSSTRKFKPVHIFLFIYAILICVGLSGVYQVITRKKGE